MKEIKLLIPADPDFVSTTRLTTSSICNYLGFDIEEIEDLRVAISEACNMLISADQIEILYRINDEKNGLCIQVSIPDSSIVYDTDIGANLGRQILSSLVDKVEYKETHIAFYKGKD